MTRINRIQLRSASVKPNERTQGQSKIEFPKAKNEISPLQISTRPRPRPHKCQLTPNLPDDRPEVTEASDLKVKVSECRRTAKEDFWEEGGRDCSLQEVAVKTPSGVVTVKHCGDAVTPNVDFVEPRVRLYKRNVLKYTYKSQFPAKKSLLGAANSVASTKILSRPPLVCDCVLDSQPALDTVKTLPNVIVKDSTNFAKFRHIFDDDRRPKGNVAAENPRNNSGKPPYPAKTKNHTLVVPRNSLSKFSDHHLKRLMSSNSLFSPDPFSVVKSRSTRIASNCSSKSSKHPTVRVVSGDVPNKMDDSLVLKRIVYRAEDVLHDDKLSSPKKSSAKPQIHPIGKARNP